MKDNQWEEYYTILNQLEENMQTMDSEIIETFLEELFEMKPVRLKWYLVKAQLMLKEKKEIDEIVEFLSDKCDPWYAYESVDEYFQIMGRLFELKGDFTESRRYRYQFHKMQEVLHGICGNNAVIDQRMALLTEKIENQTNMQVQELLELMELYYIKGNIYLYLLWAVVVKQVFQAEEIKIRDWILQKFNAEYYYERLINNKEEVFAVIITSKYDEKDCLLAAKGLKLLGKKVILLEKPMKWEKSCDIQEAVSASIESVEEAGGIDRFSTYYIGEGESWEDTRLGILQYAAKSYSKEDLITVLGSGLLIDRIAMDKKARPRFERLTPADADYLEENMSVGRYGDYLGYIANIYKISKEAVQKELYKKPGCRFSIIIPCRNAGDTLHYTLKTCLNQEFAGSYEIVVSDNSDMSWGMDTPTYRMCQEFQDDRIKYYRTPGNLSLMKNFEYAYLKAEGEFLISMGADDGILPWALKELDKVISEQSDIPVWLWHEVFYKWADVDENVMQGAGTATLLAGSTYKKGSPEIFEYLAKDVFLQSFSSYGKMYYLPQIYHNSGIRREYLQTLYKKTGVLWAGISQDMSMAVTVANMEEKLHFIDNPLTITGISNASIGANSRVGNSSLGQPDLIKKMKSTFAQGWRVPGYRERMCPITGAELSGLYACVLYVEAIGVIPDEFFDSLNWKVLYENVVREMNLEDILYDKKIHRLRYAVSLHGPEMLEWFDNQLYKQIMEPHIVKKQEKSDSGEKMYQEYIQIHDKAVEADLYSISDVYKVSLFLEKYFTGKNWNGECV